MGCATCGRRRRSGKPMPKTSPPKTLDKVQGVVTREPKPRFDRVASRGIHRNTSFGGIINKVKKER